MNIEQKRCSCCKEVISVKRFWKDKQKLSGLTSVCIDCFRKKRGNKSRREKHDFHGADIYNKWVSMRQRCTNSNHISYKYYGGKGICVCKRWDKFTKFYKDMIEGYKKGLTIDRIDNNKGYFKENCRWATTAEQNKNKSKKYNKIT